MQAEKRAAEKRSRSFSHTSMSRKPSSDSTGLADSAWEESAARPARCSTNACLRCWMFRRVADVTCRRDQAEVWGKWCVESVSVVLGRPGDKMARQNDSHTQQTRTNNGSRHANSNASNTRDHGPAAPATHPREAPRRSAVGNPTRFGICLSSLLNCEKMQARAPERERARKEKDRPLV